VVVPAELRLELERHAEEEAPNEACGLIAFRDGVAERYLPCDNAAASPYRFELKPRDPLDFFLEDEGYELAVQALANRHREHRPLGVPAVPDPLAPHG
jgi:proteasome lid subunit RPN8/RPN11